MKIFDYDLGGLRGALPTAIAIADDGKGEPLFGNDALRAPSGYTLLTNWKLLLGRTPLQIRTERSENASLDRVLERETLESIAQKYFSFLFEKILKAEHFSKLPEFIVGIPSANVDSDAARARFRRVIEGAFAKMKAPKPRFFPEPFAVFQYHWFRGDLEDIGRPQNVMIVDIGGGTTNVCVIQTSGHGRIARSGDNHKPHGVATFEKGGSNIDGLILGRIVRSTRIREANKAYFSARQAKERVASQLNERNIWLDDGASREITATVSVENQGDWILTGYDLAQIVEHRFWPDVKATIEASLLDARSAKLAKPIDGIDAVIFAGGTCQIQLLHELFRRDFGGQLGLGDCRFVLSPQFDRAVAGGLAIEACANSRLHDTKPTRIAPFLQSDIDFEVGHSLSTVGRPSRLRLLHGPKACLPKGSTILPARLAVSELVGQKIEWQFRFQQRPDRGFLKFIRRDDEELQRLHAPIAVKISPKGEVAGAQCRLRLLFNDDGIADVGLVAWNGEEGHVHYPATRLDLHDLHAMQGDVFLGLDFGTTNTFIAQVDAASIANDALPSKYKVNEATMARAKALHDDARSVLARAEKPEELVARYESNVLKDYVYHSNRIEGSTLTRGQTQRILDDVPDEQSLHTRNIQSVVERVSFIDDQGEIRTIARPVKDEVAAVNLRDAFRCVQEMAADGTSLTPFFLKAVHNLIARGDTAATPGQFRRGNVRIGQTSFVPPEGSQVAMLIEDMCRAFEEPDFRSWPAIYQAVYAHARFVSIHPFQDGNGRLARLVANYFLWRAKMPSVMLPWENRERYYDALEECNSFETSNRGDLTDLTALFCDLFEDALANLDVLGSTPLKHAESEQQAVADEPVVTIGLTKSPRLNNLLSRIGESKRAIDSEAQYVAWKSSFESLLAEVREAALLVDNAYRDGWGGAAKLREFPIVDLDTFQAIRDGRPYTRTWFFNLKLVLPKSTEDLTFFFSRVSLNVSRLDEKLNRTASLGISRMVRGEGKHVNLHYEDWSRVKEITHDGAQMGLCLVEDRILKHVTTENPIVSDWFGLLMEDATQELGGYNLSG